MANAIEQKVDVSGAVGDLRLTIEQRPDPLEGKKPFSPLHHSVNFLRYGSSPTKWPECSLTKTGNSLAELSR
jgi:hypothetical protein